VVAMGRKREPRKGLIGFLSRWFRRLRRVAVLGGVGAAAYKWWQGRSGGPSGSGRGIGDGGDGGSGRRAPIGGPLSPSPLRESATPEGESETVTAVSAPQSNRPGTSTASDAADGNGDGNSSGRLATVVPLAGTTTGVRGWVEPIAGDCPPSHPVKVKDSSGIYHLPGGRFYDRMAPERCYSSPAAAEADGYRRAKA
jgi:hypothetical protein